MSQNFSVDSFKWVAETSQFNEDFIKHYTEGSANRYFLEVDVQYPEKSNDLHNDLKFSLERIKIEKIKKLLAKLHDKKEYAMCIICYTTKFKTITKTWISI